MFLLVPAHPGFPGQIPQSRKTVVCVCVIHGLAHETVMLYSREGDLATHWLCIIPSSVAQSLGRGDEHPAYTPVVYAALNLTIHSDSRIATVI